MRRAPAGRRGRVPAGRRGSIPRGLSGLTSIDRWVVALPAWGYRYVRVLCDYTLPALAQALAPIGSSVRLLIWTDDARVRGVVQDLLPGVECELREVPGPDNSFMSMSSCHSAALAAAAPGDAVVLLTADMIVSREVLATCASALTGGKHMVCCVALRALEDAEPPVGATGRELLEWAWDNRHPMTRECTWPDGRSYDVWRMYFERGGEVSARVFLPHPLACTPRGYGHRMSFGPTIDVNLTACFPLSLIHLISQPEEGAVVEVSPADKEFILTEPMRARIGGKPSCPSLIRCVNAYHRMFWGNRVTIRGAGGPCGDEELVRVILGG